MFVHCLITPEGSELLIHLPKTQRQSYKQGKIQHPLLLPKMWEIQHLSETYEYGSIHSFDSDSHFLTLSSKVNNTGISVLSTNTIIHLI